MSRKHTASAIMLTAVVIVAGVLAGLGVQRLLDSRGASAGIDAADACVKQAAAFGEYPLVFAGKSVLGYPLGSCQDMKTDRVTDELGRIAREASNQYSFGYGDCTIPPGRDSCAIPVTIVVDPPCGLTLDQRVIKETVAVRGASALVKPDGSMRVETPTYKVSVFAPGNTFEERKANATAIMEALVPANAPATRLRAGAPLTTALGPSPACQ